MPRSVLGLPRSYSLLCSLLCFFALLSFSRLHSQHITLHHRYSSTCSLHSLFLFIPSLPLSLSLASFVAAISLLLAHRPAPRRSICANSSLLSCPPAITTPNRPIAFLSLLSFPPFSPCPRTVPPTPLCPSPPPLCPPLPLQSQQCLHLGIRSTENRMAKHRPSTLSPRWRKSV
ncbi:hypothetical protein B0O80DRAFT_448533 [Mortierella sp. GBAus27b]|nr:hypothetical protein B0O80DRAFT_448533 [Mortierella sp. GBAus27b]